MRVATIASIRPRANLLDRVVASILPQVDRLYAYLNGYDAVPQCLLQAKVAHALTSNEAGWKGTECRFFFTDPKAYSGAMRPPEDAIHLPIDDDIDYPHDYVDRMVEALDRNPGALVCVHASIFVEPFQSYATSRRQLSFASGLAADAPAHIAGMGTAAYRLNEVPVAISDFEGHRASDPVVATICRKHSIQIVSIARKAGWLRPLPAPAASSLYRQRTAANNTAAEDALLRTVEWPSLPLPQTTAFAGAAARTPRQAVTPVRPPTRSPLPEDPGPSVPPIHFALIMPGWRCMTRVRQCWESLKAQVPGSYTWEAHVWDDASDDGTWAEIQALPEDPRLHRYRSETGNLGAAHARWQLLQKLTNRDAVCALLDLDDRLEPGALARVALEYRAHPNTLATYGSWTSEGSVAGTLRDSQRRYTDEEINTQRARHAGNYATCFRTFRRFLADAIIPETHLQCDGLWIKVGTDAALMYPIVEQCRPDNIRHIAERIYCYWQRPDAARTRVSQKYKDRVRMYLRNLPPVPFFESVTERAQHSGGA